MVSIVITGGNRGIGLGLVKEFLKDGYVDKLFATTRDISKSKELTAIKDPRLHVVEMDVNSDRSICSAVHQIYSKLNGKGLDILINNSGVLNSIDVLKPMDRKAVLQNFEVNSVAVVIVSQAFLCMLKEAAAKKGVARIVNMSSFLASIQNNQGSSGDFGFLPYNMSKAALNMFTRGFSFDNKANNVHVVSLEPGWVKTDMGGPSGQLTVEESTTKLVKAIKNLKKEHNGGFYDFNLKPHPF